MVEEGKLFQTRFACAPSYIAVMTTVPTLYIPSNELKRLGAELAKLRGPAPQPSFGFIIGNVNDALLDDGTLQSEDLTLFSLTRFCPARSALTPAGSLTL